MPSTAYKGYSVPTTGTESGTWGDDINNNSFAVIDRNVGGVVSKTLAGSNLLLSATESQNLIVRLTGTLSANVQVTTACLGVSIVENLTSGAFNVTFTNGVGTPVTIPQGHRATVITDATNGPRVAGSSQIDDLTTVGVVRRLSSGLLTTDAGTTSIQFVRDNAGNVISTGIKGDMTVPFACVITGAILLADQVGSMSLDIWKAPYASYPPTAGNSICGGNYMTLSSAMQSTNTLVGWTTAVNAGDVLRFNVNSLSTITRFTAALSVTRY